MPSRHPRSVVALVALLLLAFVGSSASAESIASKRRKAAELADRIEALDAKAEGLAETVNETTVRISQLQVGVAQAKQDVSRLEGSMGVLQDRMTQWAIRSYVNSVGGTTDVMTVFAASDALDAETRAAMLEVAVGNDQELRDEARARRADIADARKRLASDLDEANKLKASLIDQQDAAEAASQAAEKLLAKTNAEIKQLLIEEQQRRDAEAAARSKAIAEQQARDRAAALAKATARPAAAAAPSAPKAARTTATARTTPSDAGTPGDQSGDQSGGDQSGDRSGDQSGGDRGQTAGTTPDTAAPEKPRPGRVIPPPSPGAQGAIEAARSQLGVPYRRFTMNPGVSFDCSGLTTWAWGQAGVSLPRSSRLQYAALPHVPVEEAQPGDLFFYGSPIHHVGLYIGDGQLIAAPYTGAVVSIRPAFRRDLTGVARP